ncbi:hypothetical protein D9M71_835470 [compost metagenome]
MQARQRLGQRLGGDHHTITQTDRLADQLAHIAWHIAGVIILLRRFDDVIVQLIDPPRTGESFVLRHILEMSR